MLFEDRFKFKTVIRYSYKGGKFTISEKRVHESFNDYGRIRADSMSIYFPERDDEHYELAKRIFIEHLEKRVIKAQDELNKATEYLRIIKEEL